MIFSFSPNFFSKEGKKEGSSFVSTQSHLMGAARSKDSWEKGGVLEERAGRAWMSSNLGAFEGESFARS